MKREKLLVLLTVTGSALCRWPAIKKPRLDFPNWIFLLVFGFIVVLSTALSNGRRLNLLKASVIGSFAGLCAGVVLFPSADGIENAYRPYGVFVATLAAACISPFAGFAGRELSWTDKSYRRALWFILAGCVAFGPVVFALTPALMRQRVARNDRLAALRFKSLKHAVEQTRSEAGGLDSVCDVNALQRHYDGPPFTQQDWRYITGNYVMKGRLLLHDFLSLEGRIQDRRKPVWRKGLWHARTLYRRNRQDGLLRIPLTGAIHDTAAPEGHGINQAELSTQSAHESAGAAARAISLVVEKPSTVGTILTTPPQERTSFAPTTVSST